jgi:HAE1 family hydrophobic/amphiphilic exporter-1
MDLRRRLAGQIPGMKIVTRAPQGQFLPGEQEGLTVEIRGFGLKAWNFLQPG